MSEKVMFIDSYDKNADGIRFKLILEDRSWYKLTDYIPFDTIISTLESWGFPGIQHPKQLIGKTVLIGVGGAKDKFAIFSIKKIERSSKDPFLTDDAYNLVSSTLNVSEWHNKINSLFLDSTTDVHYECPNCENHGGWYISAIGEKHFNNESGSKKQLCNDPKCMNAFANRFHPGLFAVPDVNIPIDPKLSLIACGDVEYKWTDNILFTCSKNTFFRYIKVLMCYARFRNEDNIKIKGFMQIIEPILFKNDDGNGAASVTNYNSKFLFLYADKLEHHGAVVQIIPDILNYRINLPRAVTWINIPNYDNSPNKNLDIDYLISENLLKKF